MTNKRHSAKVSEVWKHMTLIEAVKQLHPRLYAETNAGSPSYPLANDAEREFGVRGFMNLAAKDPVLRTTSYFIHLEGKQPLESYLGSPGWAIEELGSRSHYLLCDIDPESLDELREFAEDHHLTGLIEIADTDGMATVADRVLEPMTQELFVFIDPFDYTAAIGAGPNAIEVALQMLGNGVKFACWYGYDEVGERFWLPELLAETGDGSLWAGDILTTASDGSIEADGNLGNGTTPGTGSGMAFGNVPDSLAIRLSDLGERLENAYADATLPSGRPGGLSFSERAWRHQAPR